MKIQQTHFLILLALVVMLSCNRIPQLAAPKPKVELILKMSASDWLLQQSKQAENPRIRTLAAALDTTLQEKPQLAMHALEPILESYGWMDSLAFWFPEVVAPAQELGTPMDQLRSAYQAALRKVKEVIQRRLGDALVQVEIDPTERIHVVAEAEDGGFLIQQRLLVQGKLGFYETRNYQEIHESMWALRTATYEIENGDTTFDLYMLNYDQRDPYHQFFPELGIVADRSAILFIGEADTAEVMHAFRSDTAHKLFPPQTAFAWALPPSQDRRDVFPLIALKTDYYGDARLDGSHVTHARMDFEPNTLQPMISVEMDPSGAAEWERMTRGNIGRCVAVVFDGEVWAYPTVQTEVKGGRTQITGEFTMEEARNLAMIIEGGAYPARLEMVETKVDPKAK